MATTRCDPTAKPLTRDQMVEEVERLAARARAVELFPLACPERVRLFTAAMRGDRAAAEVLVAGATRVLALRARQAEAGEDVDEYWRHLPGKHDQKSHAGGRGGGDGVPAGWQPVTGDKFSAFTTGPGGTTVAVATADAPVLLDLDEDVRVKVMRESVASVARTLDPLIDKYGVELDARISANMPEGAGGATDVLQGMGGHLDLVSCRYSIGLFVTPDIHLAGKNPMGKMTTKVAGIRTVKTVDGKREVPLEAASYSQSSADGYTSKCGISDPVRYVITHEYGHAITAATPGERIGSVVRKDGTLMQVGETASNAFRATGERLMEKAADSRIVKSGFRMRDEVFDDMVSGFSQYGSESPDEAYAEAFADWEMRDVTRPSTVALTVREVTGWPE